MHVVPTQLYPVAQSALVEHDVLHKGTKELHAYGAQLDCTPPQPPFPSQKPAAVSVEPVHVCVQLTVVGCCSQLPAAVHLPSLPQVPLLEHWPVGG